MNKGHIFPQTSLFDSASALTQVSAGHDVPVVFTAVAFNLLPVTMIPGGLTELHCVSVATGLVA